MFLITILVFAFEKHWLFFRLLFKSSIIERHWCNFNSVVINKIFSFLWIWEWYNPLYESVIGFNCAKYWYIHQLHKPLQNNIRKIIISPKRVVSAVTLPNSIWWLSGMISKFGSKTALLSTQKKKMKLWLCCNAALTFAQYQSPTIISATNCSDSSTEASIGNISRRFGAYWLGNRPAIQTAAPPKSLVTDRQHQSLGHLLPRLT